MHCRILNKHWLHLFGWRWTKILVLLQAAEDWALCIPLFIWITTLRTRQKFNQFSHKEDKTLLEGSSNGIPPSSSPFVNMTALTATQRHQDTTWVWSSIFLSNIGDDKVVKITTLFLKEFHRYPCFLSSYHNNQSGKSVVQMFLFAIRRMMLPGWNLRNGLVSTFKSNPPKPAGEILALIEQTYPWKFGKTQQRHKTYSLCCDEWETVMRALLGLQPTKYHHFNPGSTFSWRSYYACNKSSTTQVCK